LEKIFEIVPEIKASQLSLIFLGKKSQNQWFIDVCRHFSDENCHQMGYIEYRIYRTNLLMTDATQKWKNAETDDFAATRNRLRH
jgi:hypothetical protein